MTIKLFLRRILGGICQTREKDKHTTGIKEDAIALIIEN